VNEKGAIDPGGHRNNSESTPTHSDDERYQGYSSNERQADRP